MSSTKEREEGLRKIWNDLKGQLPTKEKKTDLGVAFSIVTGEGSLEQPGASSAQIKAGNAARYGVAANRAKQKTANPANGGKKYSAMETLKSDSHVYTGGPGSEEAKNKRKAAGENYFDKGAGEPRFDRMARTPRLYELGAATMTNAYKFVADDYTGLTNGIPPDATSYGDGGVAEGATVIRKGNNPHVHVTADLPPGFVVGRRGAPPSMSVKFPKGETVGRFLETYGTSLEEVKKLNPGFDDRKVKVGDKIKVNPWDGNLKSEGRPLYLFHDDKGKVTGYGTTESIVVPGIGDQAGRFVIVPTIVDGKKLSDDEARAHYAKTKEFWASRKTKDAAIRASEALHEDHARIYGPQWNEYIEAHPDELSEKLKAEIEESKKAEVRQDAEGGTSRRDADVAKEAEKIRGTRIRVEGDHGAVKGTVAEVAGLAPAAQRGRIESAIRVDAANRARRAEYDRLAAENREFVGEAGLARYDEITAKGRPDARSQTSDALAYALRDNPVLAPESRPDVPARPTHDENGHPLTYTQDSKWVPDAAPRATRRESSADREFREATHVPTGVTIIGDQKFTTYADGTIGDTTAEHIREARESRALSEALLRQDAKGGDAGGEVTENAEIVNSGEAADTPVTNGPRIVINPTTFRNGKDALCVAFNERFRIWMEAEGFNPQSEPTEKQREFFNDTAYADDELMLRRTILARIATLDTSVKDPTDAQISDTLQMLRQFKETERPDDAWQANALGRIIGLVQSVEPAERATPQPT